MKKAVLCGVPYSDNLGDGVIAQCLSKFLEEDQGYDVTLCDISYRSEVTLDNIKGYKLNNFNRLPSFVRLMIVLVFFVIKFLRKGRSYLTSRFRNADVCFVGGGQLLSDVDANFPLKLFFVALMAEKFKLPIYVVSVGVGGKWSPVGRALMGRFLRSRMIHGITVRDERSQEILKREFNLSSDLLPDPALMCSFYFDAQQRLPKCPKLRIGLGVADLQGLNYSSDVSNSYALNNQSHWLELVRYFDGQEVVLFTNGALEDEIYLHSKLEPFLLKSNVKYSVAERSRSDLELMKLISGFDQVYAFRLHANIVSASYNVYHCAIAWDQKVRSFFKMQGREELAFGNLAALAKGRALLPKEPVFQTALNPELVREHYRRFINRTIA